MTREEREQAIAILENEKKCVNRANKNDYCNRDCYNCELVKTDTEILTALDMAIKALQEQADTIPVMYYPQVDGITPTVVAQADKSKGKALEQEPSRDMEEIVEVINCDADAETKCKMISNILIAKPHYFEEQEPAYCDRNICLRNEYNSIGCNECEVTKSQESNTVIGTGDGAYYRIKALQAQVDGEKSFFCSHCGERLENEN